MSKGTVQIVGAGPGALNQLTPAAQQALASSSAWVGYGLYLDLLEPLRRPDQVRFDGQLTKEKERIITLRSDRLTSRPRLAYSYNGLPLCFTAEYIGGI